MSAKPIKPLTGYYGKVPSQGDFVKYNFPRDFIEPWDDWLQNALAATKAQLGDNWLNQYLTSPIYRFILTPGICGTTAWMGIVMPSVDRIGRYFPMTLAAAVPNEHNPINALSDFDDWFCNIEKLVLSCLDETFNINSLQTALAELDNLLLSDDTVPNKGLDHTHLFNLQESRRLAIHLSLDNAKPFHTSTADLLYAVTIQTCFSISLWRTTGSDRIQSSILLTQGLPPINSMTALYDGNWERWGWLSNQTGIMTPADGN